MTNLTQANDQETQQVWRLEYFRQLDQRLDITISYLANSPRAQVRSHIRSFLTLLSESHRSPDLTQKAIALITKLHPLPLRWGLGHLWEAELQFALNHINPLLSEQAAEYMCSLGDVYLFRGQFERAAAQAEMALSESAASLGQQARAVRILFTCYRSSGQPQKADVLIEQNRARFFGDRAAEEVPVHASLGWLTYQQCRLELLREQGEVDRALSLSEEMIWLDDRTGAADKVLTADLYTHRSTLLWVRSRYPEAVSDLKQAMQLFEQVEDTFNSESLKSNLGLVYWTMGELDLAEETLLSVMRFFRETGSDQLLTYVIANLGLVYFARGDLDAALKLTQEHIALSQRINFIHEYNRGRRNLGTILYYFGEYERSIEETTASHKYYETRGSRDAYGLDNLWLALCFNALGELDRALKMAVETLSWAKAHQSRVLEQVTLRCMAEFLPQEDRETPLQRSLALACEMDRKLEEAAVRLKLASVYKDQRSQEAWDAGAAILERIGAGKWLSGRSMVDPPFIPLLL